jgi:phenylacetate-coenzyme A ligase PaaK-like adenylate-forming protein
MVTYGGANVFPDMVYKALASIGMDDKFQVRLETSAVSHRDRLVIQVEGDARTENDIDTLEKTIESHLREQSAELDYVFNRGLVNPIRFDIVDYGTLYDRKGKFKHFLDTRQTVVTGEATTN